MRWAVGGSGDQTEEMEATAAYGVPVYPDSGQHALLPVVLKKLQELKEEIVLFREENRELRKEVTSLREESRLKDRKTLTVAEAANHAGVKSETVRRWLESGALKGRKRGEHKQAHWTVRANDLNAFLDRNVNQVTVSPSAREVR